MSETAAPDGLFSTGEVVSRVKPDTRDATIVHVYVGSRKRASVPVTDAEKLGIAPGAPWTPQLQNACELAIGTRRALRRATGWLASGELTAAELRTRLEQAGFFQSVIAAVLAKLTDTFAQRDERAADAALRKLIRRLPASTERMEAVLDAKGVSEDDSAAAISRATQGESDDDLALRAAYRVFESLPKGLDATAAWRRVLGALSRRGFSEEVAMDAARRALGEPPEDAPEDGPHADADDAGPDA
ncbi:MAG: RecX family transcriptional regulator [Phycisphaerales bacterium]|jgi:SOS response regulatory protein OraA/RecX